MSTTMLGPGYTMFIQKIVDKIEKQMVMTVQQIVVHIKLINVAP